MTETSTDLAKGDVVSGLSPDELVEVTSVAPFGSKFLIEGIGTESKKQYRRPLTADEIAAIRKVRGTDRTFDGDPALFLLGAEAERIRIAHQFDPLFAVNSSIVDPLPHQVEAVYRFLLPMPRIRFLLADDTGAGKTIMTGLLIKELQFRGVISKILIVTPGGLTKQWKEDELQAKFGIRSRLVNRASFDAEPDQFARLQEGTFVVSIDFISRNDACLNAAAETRWDLIVVDEAHKLSAYEYGSKLDKSSRYAALERLARATDHLLFLTATPHRGRKDTFRRLLLLLDEDLFRKDTHVEERVTAGKSPQGALFESEESITKSRNRFFLRRLKEEMVDWDGSPLFRKRTTKTSGYDLTPEELELYNAVTKYVRSRRKEAKEKKNRNVELTLMVMQRRLASSVFAITRTLQNRRAALGEVLTILRDPRRSQDEKDRLFKVGLRKDDPSTIESYEELDEKEREEVDDRILRFVLSRDPVKVEAEMAEVAELCRMAESLRNHKEAKFQELLDLLDSSDVIRSDKEKLVIFTEHKDTLNNLRERLEGMGYTVAIIHGGMDVDERKKAQRDFYNRAKIMIATDAAGEGINLQFCRYLINWDIPWNPNRLEQRMGRIHRYGQQSDVHVYNLVAQNTCEGAVIQKVLEKLDVMREQMGDDRVYDVIDEWLEDVPLVQLIERAIDSEDRAAALEATEASLSEKATRARADELVDLQKKSSLASRLNLKAASELRDASDERRLQPLFVEKFFNRAWRQCGGDIRQDPDFPVWRLGPVPAAIRDAVRRKRLYVSEEYDEPFVFDKKLLSVASPIRIPENTRLLGPGHELFDAVIEWAIQESRQAFARGTVVVDPNIARPHKVWLVRSIIEDGRIEAIRRKAHEQLNVIVNDHLGIRRVAPSYLLDCVPPEAGITRPDLPTVASSEIEAWAYENVTEKQLARCAADRKEECELRRDYLNTAFTDLIMDLQEELNTLQQENLLGEENEEQQAELRNHIKKLQERRTERLQELELMLKLTANLPETLTEAMIVPAPAVVVEKDDFPGTGVPMRRDDEVEAIAMQTVMAYERSRGWTPADVSKDGLHYDIRSEAPSGEKRFIEVKGRAQSGAIMLTSAELDKLTQLSDRAWLYIVTHCRGEKPRLRLIQDPGAVLKPEMLYRQVQYLVSEGDWKSQGEEVTSAEEISRP